MYNLNQIILFLFRTLPLIISNDTKIYLKNILLVILVEYDILCYFWYKWINLKNYTENIQYMCAKLSNMTDYFKKTVKLT